jgi:hypothetical protein
LVYLTFYAIIATGYSLASHFRVYFPNEADERLIRDLFIHGFEMFWPVVVKI